MYSSKSYHSKIYFERIYNYFHIALLNYIVQSQYWSLYLFNTNINWYNIWEILTRWQIYLVPLCSPYLIFIASVIFYLSPIYRIVLWFFHVNLSTKPIHKFCLHMGLYIPRAVNCIKIPSNARYVQIQTFINWPILGYENIFIPLTDINYTVNLALLNMKWGLPQMFNKQTFMQLIGITYLYCKWPQQQT